VDLALIFEVFIDYPKNRAAALLCAEGYVSSMELPG
jgi:hypothetical protein